jgi:hypothetical protein
MVGVSVRKCFLDDELNQALQMAGGDALNDRRYDASSRIKATPNRAHRAVIYRKFSENTLVNVMNATHNLGLFATTSLKQVT